jgi:NADPH:quinone reductase-like Zn-dependent oxidoreductase
MGEVRVRVEAIGVSFLDVLGRIGKDPEAPDIPFVPGYGVAGMIDMVAQGVTELKEGDAVLASTHFGGYSDLVCIPHAQVFRRLEWMSAEDGAALVLDYPLAYLMLVVLGSLRKGTTVLIHDAATEVGIAAVDICRSLGAKTFGTAPPDKHDFLRERGLAQPIDYYSRDYEEVVRQLTNGRGVQLILDPFGGLHWKKNYRLLMPTGRVVHFSSGRTISERSGTWLDMLSNLLVLPFYTPLKLMKDNKGVLGVNLAYLWPYTELQREWMEQIITWYDEALFRPRIDRVFSFNQVPQAHHYVQQRKNAGKVLLAP